MIVHIEALGKTYPGGIRALHDINLEIGPGMFGLLGPNGAGKTTLLRILATLLRPTTGRVRVDAFDLADPQQKWAIKQILGYLPQELGFYDSLAVGEFLEYMAVLKNLHDPAARAAAVDKALHLANLRPQARQRIGALSGGVKRRLGIAQALLGDPRLLIVDEPTAGLDPEERVRFRSLLAELATDRIVILSTHIVEDIAATCQELAVLHQGRVRFHGSPAALAQSAAGQVWELPLPPAAPFDPAWRITSRLQLPDLSWRLRLVGPRPAPEALPAAPTLEEAYLVMMEAIPIPKSLP